MSDWEQRLGNLKLFPWSDFQLLLNAEHTVRYLIPDSRDLHTGNQAMRHKYVNDSPANLF